ncbi:hypothetical protein [Mycoplasma suis]|uniref:Uncharacterized protein n=2 Tax=Mycoplasma suis TaxID=57372 RepID=F0QQ43_MYCSL|nr:hypothetical protein [Mycoplasma suis]ADX97613.1 hypothetical protein MSU_0069 [Mycoplasma suis str. Illinois]CBZ40148.1 hypothetical protein MSUIS_00550 [Mycoplasma suis KI3806]
MSVLELKEKEKQDPNFSIEWCYSDSKTLEEKISNTLLLLSTVDGIPSIEQLLGDLKVQKSNALSSYDALSSSIRSELLNHIDNLFELKLSNSKLEKNMDSLLYTIRISSPFTANFSHEKLPQSREYRQFLQLYSEHMEGVQKTVKLKSKISLLLDSQRVLDKNYASKMAHIDYQIISLGKILDNLTESNKEEVGSLYFSQFNKLDGLIKEITDSEEKFTKLKRSMNIIHENLFSQGIQKEFVNDVTEVVDDFPYKELGL